jgi:uncharacterized protein (TIGR00251 family)
MRLVIKVIPNAKQNEIATDIIDLLGVRNLRIRINQPPEDGKANKAVIDLLAQYLNVKKRDISIVSGLTSRNKLIEVDLP